MDVRGDRPTDAEVVGAGLLLADRPRRPRECVDQRRPLDAGLDLDESPAFVDGDDAGEQGRVEDDAVCTELLSAHRMTAACDRYGDAGRPRAVERRADRLGRVDRYDLGDRRLVQAGVDVVDDGHRCGVRSNGTKENKVIHALASAAAITSPRAISRAWEAMSFLVRAVAGAPPAAVCELRFVMPRRYERGVAAVTGRALDSSRGLPRSRSRGAPRGLSLRTV